MKQEIYLHPDVMPLLLVMTDGAGNVSIDNRPPQEEAHMLAKLIASEEVHSVVVNMESIHFDQGLAAQLAEYQYAAYPAGARPASTRTGPS